MRIIVRDKIHLDSTAQRDKALEEYIKLRVTRKLVLEMLPIMSYGQDKDDRVDEIYTTVIVYVYNEKNFKRLKN